MKQPANPINKIYLIFILLFISLGSFLFVQVVMDDAYIPFRYGFNLVNYHLWNFYPNTQRMAEAYTTFLYTVLSVVPAVLHIHPYIVYKITGALCFFTVIAMLYRSAGNKNMALFAILVFTANWQTYVHTYSGLETMLWCSLYLAIIILLNEETNKKRQASLWILCLLLILTRPEGILVAVFAFCYLQFARKEKIHYVALLLCTCIGIAYFSWRYQHFGMLFPLPYYQKTIKNNAGIINIIINTFNSVHYIIAVVAFFLIYKQHSYFRRMAIFSLAIFFVVYGRSLLTMNFADRFSYQLFFPPLLYGIISSAALSQNGKKKIRICSTFLLLFIFAKGFYYPNIQPLSSIDNNLFSGYYYSRAHLNLALHLRKLHHPGMKVFCNEAGIFSYYSNIDYYDPEGLTNKDLCTKTITPEYIEQINPDVFLYLVTIPKENVNKWVNGMGPRHPLYYYRYLLSGEQYDKIGYVACVDRHAYIGIAINKKSKYYSEVYAAGKDAIAVSEKDTFSIKKFLQFQYYRSYPAL